MTDTRESRAHLRLGPGGEFDIIRRMLERWGELARGIGDDAAIVRPPAGEQLVVSTDSSVEDVHFRRGWLDFHEIAYRATAAAMSDLAAMAANPVGVFVALTLPEADVVAADELADGMAEGVRSAETHILGGDVTRGDKLSLTLTVLGSARRPLTRGAAAMGDRVYVTGRLGGPLAVLRELRDGGVAPPELRHRFAHPVPRLREARWLADHGANAAIDVSDGLMADAQHLAVASGAVVTIRSESVPVLAGVAAVDALTSGEEYELIVTSPDVLDAARFRGEFALDLTDIGQVIDGEPGVLLTAGGRRVAAPPGYDHFAG